MVCRRKQDGIRIVNFTENDIVEQCADRLLDLKKNKILVGAGDIRSVVRGSLLSYHMARNEFDSVSLEKIDAIADQVIGRLEGASIANPGE